MDVQDITYHAVTGVDDFEHVVGIELGNGYEWNSFQAWWSPSER